MHSPEDFSRVSDAKLLNLIEWVESDAAGKWIVGLVNEILRLRAALRSTTATPYAP